MSLVSFPKNSERIAFVTRIKMEGTFFKLDENASELTDWNNSNAAQLQQLEDDS